MRSNNEFDVLPFHTQSWWIVLSKEWSYFGLKEGENTCFFGLFQVLRCLLSLFRSLGKLNKKRCYWSCGYGTYRQQFTVIAVRSGFTSPLFMTGGFPSKTKTGFTPADSIRIVRLNIPWMWLKRIMNIDFTAICIIVFNWNYIYFVPHRKEDSFWCLDQSPYSAGPAFSLASIALEERIVQIF